MYQKEKTVAFSGHRSERLPQTEEARKKLEQGVYDEIDQAIKDGYDTFLIGACYGFDLMCAQQVLYRKRVLKQGDPPKIRLIAAVPYEEQAAKWSEADRELYYNTLAECDDVVTLNTHYKQGCFYERNRWMVDRASRLICYYDGGNSGTGHTVDYARKKGLEIINLLTSTIE